MPDFEEAYEAANEAVAVFDRSHRHRIRVTGADAESFLQNMLSQDVKGLSPGKGRRATFLTNKGKLVADLLVFREAGRFLLELESTCEEAFLTAISRYIISEDVALVARDSEETGFSLEGARASRLLGELARTDPAELDSLSDLEFRQIEPGGMPASVTAHRREPSPRYDVVASREHASALFTTAVDRGAVPAGVVVAETRRIEAGRPRFGIDMDSSHLPLEAGLDEAIHFEKGCYIGQEYVARLAHRGHVNRKLMGLRLAGTAVPERGASVLLRDREVGTVTSAAYSPRVAATLALAYLKRECFEPGTELGIRVDGTALDAIVSPLPFEAP